MPAVALPAGLPALSQLKSATFDHLGAFADSCDRIAAKASSVFGDLAQAVVRPGGVEWEGAGGAAAVGQAHADARLVRPWVFSRQEAAQIARRGQDRLQAAQHDALAAVADAQRDDFTVGEDYSCTDTRTVSTREELAKRQGEAQAHASFIRHRVANLVANDHTLATELQTTTAHWGELTFPGTPIYTDDNKNNGVQLVDNKMRKDAPAPTPPSEPDPVGKLGLPDYSPGSLSGEEARGVYAQGELRMRELNDQLIKQGLSSEERAKVMFEQRNSLRSWVRDLMGDRDGAADVTAKNPNYTWDEIVAQRKARGLSGNDLYDSIIESSTRSRTSVNDALGIDPNRPPPLPPVYPPPPVGGAGPGPAPLISAPPVLPPVGEHPPVAVPPPVTDHPPVALPPPVLDHPPLPSWLQDPSPPGFQIGPHESAPTFTSDLPSSAAMPPPAGPPVTIPSPHVSPEDATKGGVLVGAGAVGAWILSQLPKLVHPFGP